MKCAKCGFELEEGAVFCPSCGTKVENGKPEVNEEKTVIYGFSRDSQDTADKEKNKVEEAPDNPDEHAELPTNSEKNEEDEQITGSSTEENRGDESVESVFCHECGSRNSKEDKFCHVCGKPLGQAEAPKEPEKIFCHSCGTANDPADLFCINCGSPLGKSGKGVKNGNTNSGVNLPVKGIIGAVAAIVVIVALFFIVKGIFSGGKGNSDELIYIKDNELMRYGAKANTEIDDGIIDYTDNSYGIDVSYSVKMTDDGSKLYYPTDYDGYAFDLCVKEMKKKSDSGVKIDSDVVNYSLIGNDKVVYIKDSSERKLYISDLKGNKTKVDSEVENFWLSEDEKKLLWKTDNSDDNRLYYVDTALKNDKNKIDSEITQFLTKTDDFSKIYYMKDDSLYEVLGLEEKNKVDSNIMGCWANEDDNNIILYYTINDDYNLSELVTDDDKAEEDAKMKEPDISDYQHKETKDSFWGPQEQVVTDDSYYKDVEKYEEKIERDNIRNRINDVMNQGAAYYSYTPGGEPVKLTADYGWIDIEPYDTGLIYYTINPEKIEKVELSKLAGLSESQITEKLMDAVKGAAEAHLNVFGEDVELDIDLEDYSPGAVYCDTKNKMAYIAVNDYGITGSSSANTEIYLYRSNYSKGKGELEKVCDEYDGYSARVVDGVLYYVCERDKNGSGDLYAKGERISSDVDSFMNMSEDNGIMFWTDRDKNGIGTLNTFDGKKAEKISDDVYTARSDSEGNLAFLTDYSFSKYRGDLKLFKSGKIISVDSDVSSIAYFD